MKLKDLARYPDHFPRDALAAELKKPPEDIPPSALELAVKILEGEVALKPSVKKDTAKRKKERDFQIYSQMVFYTELGVPAFNRDKDFDASTLVSNALKAYYVDLKKGRALNSENVRKVYAELVKKEESGKYVIGEAMVRQRRFLARAIKKANKNMTPTCWDELTEMGAHWDSLPDEEAKSLVAAEERKEEAEAKDALRRLFETLRRIHELKLSG